MQGFPSKKGQKRRLIRPLRKVAARSMPKQLDYRLRDVGKVVMG